MTAPGRNTSPPGDDPPSTLSFSGCMPGPPADAEEHWRWCRRTSMPSIASSSCTRRARPCAGSRYPQVDVASSCPRRKSRRPDSRPTRAPPCELPLARRHSCGRPMAHRGARDQGDRSAPWSRPAVPWAGPARARSSSATTWTPACPAHPRTAAWRSSLSSALPAPPARRPAPEDRLPAPAVRRPAPARSASSSRSRAFAACCPAASPGTSGTSCTARTSPWPARRDQGPRGDSGTPATPPGRLARVMPGDDHPTGGGVVLPGLGHPRPDLLLERAVVSHAMSLAAMLPRAPIAWLSGD